jgi:hypothetical protein
VPGVQKGVECAQVDCITNQTFIQVVFEIVRLFSNSLKPIARHAAPNENRVQLDNYVGESLNEAFLRNSVFD